MPHDEDKDMIFTDTDLKALLLKSVPMAWQNAYLLRCTRNTDNFRQMLSYFIQFQNITNAQGFSKLFATPQNSETKQQQEYSRTNRGRSGHFQCPHQDGQRYTDRIPRKTNSVQSEPFINYKDVDVLIIIILV